jgi:hypothetical protein
MENRSENEVSEDANSLQPGIANPLNLASLEMGCGPDGNTGLRWQVAQFHQV